MPYRLKRIKNTYKRGLLAEYGAAWLLRLKGYSILEQRFKTYGGEIDLIAKRGKTLIAVEVKYRDTLMLAAESITRNQRRRIVRALELYRHQTRCRVENIRFDAILFSPYKWPMHIQNAWQADI